MTIHNYNIKLHNPENKSTNLSKCFPVRYCGISRLFDSNKWIKKGAETKNSLPTEKKPLKSNEYKYKTLNKKFLLDKACVKFPHDVCYIRIIDENLNKNDDADFVEFINLLAINASENELKLEHFQNFPQLQCLEMSMNQMDNLNNIDYKKFNLMTALDLSFNNLTNSNDIEHLALLPQLNRLNLSNNLFTKFPDRISSYLLKGNIEPFNSLEHLVLDCNKFCSANLFVSIAGFKRLKKLSISHNDLAFIPRISYSKEKNNFIVNYDKAYTPYLDEKPDENPYLESLKEVDDYMSNKWRINKPNLKENCIPFCEIIDINIDNNLISDEKCIISLSLWPQLNSISLVGNPIILNNKNNPPLLQNMLVNTRNITIYRYRKKEKYRKLSYINYDSQLHNRYTKPLKSLTYDYTIQNTKHLKLTLEKSTANQCINDNVQLETQITINTSNLKSENTQSTINAVRTENGNAFMTDVEFKDQHIEENESQQLEGLQKLKESDLFDTIYDTEYDHLINHLNIDTLERKACRKKLNTVLSNPISSNTVEKNHYPIYKSTQKLKSREITSCELNNLSDILYYKDTDSKILKEAVKVYKKLQREYLKIINPKNKQT